MKTCSSNLFIALTGAILLSLNSIAKPQTVNYKCIFNHELLIICHNRTNNAAYIKSFITKLKNTDVDAIMCCPTAWRTNLFPSEVDPTWKKYRPDQPLSKFPSYDYIMLYLYAGGDPVKDTLEACRVSGKAFFISYRMNDHHYMDDVEWPCHNDFWREHPQYWLGDTDTSPYKRKENDKSRLFNYMLKPVRDYYFSIISELCDNYDVDGLELDFQRFPKFFYSYELDKGTEVMTEFVRQLKTRLDSLSKERGKTLKMCIRVPETLEKCRKAGLDVPEWAAQGLIDMINVSTFYNHSIDQDIEDFKAAAPSCRIYGEMNYVTHQITKGTNSIGKSTFFRRYTTPEIYRGSACNLLSRGADGISLFNFDYVPGNKRLQITETLKGICDMDFLRKCSKSYVLTGVSRWLPASDEVALKVFIPDNTKEVKFKEAVLRIETHHPCTNAVISANLNGASLTRCERTEIEMFPTVIKPDPSYPRPELTAFFAIPLDTLIPGMNELHLKNLDPKKVHCRFQSIDIALIR